MELTRIKRKELKTGDLYCETIGMFQCPIFVQRYPGDTEQPTSLQQLDVLRINPPDSAHRVGELLASTKRAYESLHQRYDELEELHDVDIQSWSKRESELLQMVEERDDRVKELDDSIEDMRFHRRRDLGLLDDILKIVNTTIHHKMKSPYRKNDAYDADRMREVCDVVLERCHRMLVQIEDTCSDCIEEEGKC